MKQALNMEMGFFNTTPQMAHLIVGADVALQDQLGMNDENEKAITGLKTGLMGPFAGVGDTIFVAIYNAIIYSITAYLALSNQPIGLLIPVIWFAWSFYGFAGNCSKLACLKGPGWQQPLRIAWRLSRKVLLSLG